MSMENELKRIADLLETLVGVLKENPESTTPTSTLPPARTRSVKKTSVDVGAEQAGASEAHNPEATASAAAAITGAGVRAPDKHVENKNAQSMTFDMGLELPSDKPLPPAKVIVTQGMVLTAAQQYMSGAKTAEDSQKRKENLKDILAGKGVKTFQELREADLSDVLTDVNNLIGAK